MSLTPVSTDLTIECLAQQVRDLKREGDAVRELLSVALQHVHQLTEKNARLAFALRTMTRETQDLLKEAA